MRKLKPILLTCLFGQLALSCTKMGDSPGFSGSEYSVDLSSGGARSGNGSNSDTAGVMTAGEWNDLSHWNFWNELLQRDTIKTFPETWGFFLQNKIIVVLKDANNKLIPDANIKLESNGKIVTAKTSNDGKAVLFVSIYEPGFTPGNFNLYAEYMGNTYNLGSYSSSQTEIIKTIPVVRSVNRTLDILFAVDATGSMSDEISFLKTELKDVITRAGGQLPGTQIRMGSVFYRDIGDAYLTRPFDFNTNTDQLLNFIKDQFAGGGGDFPEAVDEALKVAMQQQWSSSAINRLLFLILDAPPHKNPVDIERLKTAITSAQQKGVRIIPISASGIDKETEFLLRFLSISTNSTYVFITGHSGIGNPHLTPTVGDYDVEFLNNLMVRLITQYGQNMD